MEEDYEEYCRAYWEDKFERYAEEIMDGIREEIYRDCFKPLDRFQEQESRWVIPGWLPEEQITLLAADGGTGKTSLWVNILAALSSGGRCLLDPPGYRREPVQTAFFPTEDRVRKKLRRKLREAGAEAKNILTMDLSGDKEGALREFKFGSPMLAECIRRYRPALCVFDPIQGFIPPKVNMGSRNEMRDCLAPLMALGEETGTSFLLICHTNKRKGAWGRERISDSADLWDAARSVWMAGYTEEQDIRYLSQEKNSYDALRETLLFTIGRDGQVQEEGRTWKRDREFMQSRERERTAAKREDCKEWILRQLEEKGEMGLGELEKAAEAAGYSYGTYRRAKEILVKQEKAARTWSTGYGEEKRWMIAHASPSGTSK